MPDFTVTTLSHPRKVKGGVAKLLDEYFEVTARGSSVLQELRGGLATFLTMSYILLVNPQVLTVWIKPPDSPTPDCSNECIQQLTHLKTEYTRSIATATALCCGFGSILVGVLAKMPFAIGPGMGLNTFVAGLFLSVSSIKDLHDAEATWDQVTSTTFLVGLVLTLLSIAGIVAPAIALMPDTIKTAIMVGIGAYQAFIGFREMAIIKSNGSDLVGLEDLPSCDWDRRGEISSCYAQLLFILCLTLMVVLFMKEVRGSILLGIIVTTALAWAMQVGGGKFPWPPVETPTLSTTLWTVDLKSWFAKSGLKKYTPELVAMLLITVFDCGGVQFGIAKLLDLPRRYKEAAMEQRSHIDHLQDEGPTSAIVYGAHASDSEVEHDVLDDLLPRRRDTNASIGSALERRGDMHRLENQLRLLQELESEGVPDLSAAKAQVVEQIQLIETNNGNHSLHDARPILPGRSSQFTFVCVGLVNLLSAAFGSSPCIVFLECAAGVKEGARTGLASVFTGMFFLVTIFLTPIFQHVPMCASAAPLVFVGCLMMSHVDDIQWKDLKHAFPAFLCILMMPFTSSITPGIGFGLAYYILLRLGLWLFDVVVTPCRSTPALHAACKRGDVDEVRRLLDEGMLPNIPDGGGNTPLHIAAERGEISIIHTLLLRGADPSALNKNKQTPLDVALNECADVASALQDAVSTRHGSVHRI
eukprot:Sspe_Gene.28683::Locus_13152_Transcript_5_5_Confidence_0.500_Length_2263::g.28683::m.28683/K06901/pbuG; putative MFS transporter, AGZA family, xanthine/uracil permease